MENKNTRKLKNSCIFVLTKMRTTFIIDKVICYGEVAQLARAFGSYPKGHVFESHLRYQKLINIYTFMSFIFY